MNVDLVVRYELIKAGCHDLCCPVSDNYKYSFDFVNII